MNTSSHVKSIVWVGSSRSDLKAFPDEVQDDIHVFQKKSKKGHATPKTDIDIIKKRLRVAEKHYRMELAVRGHSK